MQEIRMIMILKHLFAERKIGIICWIHIDFNRFLKDVGDKGGHRGT